MFRAFSHEKKKLDVELSNTQCSTNIISVAEVLIIWKDKQDIEFEKCPDFKLDSFKFLLTFPF